MEQSTSVGEVGRESPKVNRMATTLIFPQDWKKQPKFLHHPKNEVRQAHHVLNMW